MPSISFFITLYVIIRNLLIGKDEIYDEDIVGFFGTVHHEFDEESFYTTLQYRHVDGKSHGVVCTM